MNCRKKWRILSPSSLKMCWFYWLKRLDDFSWSRLIDASSRGVSLRGRSAEATIYVCMFCALTWFESRHSVCPSPEIWTGFNFLHSDSQFQPTTLNKGPHCVQTPTHHSWIKSSPQTRTFSGAAKNTNGGRMTVTTTVSVAQCQRRTREVVLAGVTREEENAGAQRWYSLNYTLTARRFWRDEGKMRFLKSEYEEWQYCFLRIVRLDSAITITTRSGAATWCPVNRNQLPPLNIYCIRLLLPAFTFFPAWKLRQFEVRKRGRKTVVGLMAH